MIDCKGTGDNSGSDGNAPVMNAIVITQFKQFDMTTPMW